MHLAMCGAPQASLWPPVAAFGRHVLLAGQIALQTQNSNPSCWCGHECMGSLVSLTSEQRLRCWQAALPSRRNSRTHAAGPEFMDPLILPVHVPWMCCWPAEPHSRHRIQAHAVFLGVNAWDHWSR